MAVDREAVREQSVVGRAAVDRAGHQERGVEPAAVLVRALEVQVGREFQLLALPEHGVVRGAGVEPHVQRVGGFLVIRRLRAEQLLGFQPLPGLDAFALDAPGDFLEQLGRARVFLARLSIEEERDRHAPVALPRYAPVRAVGDHAVQPRLAPLGVEARRVDCGQRDLAQRPALASRHVVHADEPLRGRAIDDRCLVAPAVHVAVVVSLRMQK